MKKTAAEWLITQFYGTHRIHRLHRPGCAEGDIESEKRLNDRRPRLAYHAHKVRSEQPASVQHLAPRRSHSPASALICCCSEAEWHLVPLKVQALCPDSGTCTIRGGPGDDPCRFKMSVSRSSKLRGVCSLPISPASTFFTHRLVWPDLAFDCLVTI